MNMMDDEVAAGDGSASGRAKGRPKVSAVSRQEQLRLAQRRRRKKLKSMRLVPLNVMLPQATVENLNRIKDLIDLQSLAEVIILLADAALEKRLPLL